MNKTLAELRAKRANGDDGFTLIELLVVVVILGVLIAIAIPLYLNYRKGANDSASESDVRNAISVLEVCNTGSSYPSTAATWTATTTICSTQTINVSSGTTLKYIPTVSGTTAASYVLIGANSGGTVKYWCYNSSKGGDVAAGTTTDTSSFDKGIASTTC